MKADPKILSDNRYSQQGSKESINKMQGLRLSIATVDTTSGSYWNTIANNLICCKGPMHNVDGIGVWLSCLCQSTHKFVPGPVTVLYPTVWLSSKQENDDFRRDFDFNAQWPHKWKRARSHGIWKINSHHYSIYWLYIQSVSTYVNVKLHYGDRYPLLATDDRLKFLFVIFSREKLSLGDSFLNEPTTNVDFPATYIIAYHELTPALMIALSAFKSCCKRKETSSNRSFSILYFGWIIFSAKVKGVKAFRRAIPTQHTHREFSSLGTSFHNERNSFSPS